MAAHHGEDLGEPKMGLLWKRLTFITSFLLQSCAIDGACDLDGFFYRRYIFSCFPLFRSTISLPCSSTVPQLPGSHPSQHLGNIRFWKNATEESTWQWLDVSDWSGCSYTGSWQERSVNTKQTGTCTLCNRLAGMKWWASTYLPLLKPPFISLCFHLLIGPYVSQVSR